jgi:hypothetical protein
MKKTILGILASMMLVASAYAGMAEDNTGCGLGTMLWKNNADNSMLFQAFQATTNGSFGAQTFGISSGTSGCRQPSQFVKNETLIRFASANLDTIAKEMAMGKGESLDTLAELMQVPTEKRSAFGTTLQANFGKIFPTGNEDYASVLDSVYTIINS